MSARPIRGIFLPVDDALFLAAALRQLVHALQRMNQRPVPRVVELERELAGSVRSSETGTSEQDASEVVPQSIYDDLWGTTRAAAVLGCSSENVRGLCRRGVLPATRTAGRWLIPAEAVTDRLGKEHRCRTSASTSSDRAVTSPAAPPPQFSRAVS